MDIRRSRFDHVYGDRGATCGHIRVFRSRSDMRFSQDHGIVAHDHRAIVAVNRSSPNQTVQDFHGNFFNKTVFFPLCILTLDWIVKELSGFWVKSWVLRDPLAFRLDFNPIGAGLITNHHEIWSNSPLEGQKYVKERIDQIHSNWCDYEPKSLGQSA